MSEGTPQLCYLEIGVPWASDKIISPRYVRIMVITSFQHFERPARHVVGLYEETNQQRSGTIDDNNLGGLENMSL